MGLRTHSDESALLSFIDSKQATRDFRRSATAMLTTATRVAVPAGKNRKVLGAGTGNWR